MDNIDSFLAWASLRETSLNIEDPLVISITEESLAKTNMYIRHLRPYMDNDVFISLKYNFMLHNICCSPLMEELYNKYDVTNKDMIVSSASNSGSSSSIQTFKSLEEGEFMMLDLSRTPYGRLAYSILESLKGVAFTLL